MRCVDVESKLLAFVLPGFLVYPGPEVITLQILSESEGMGCRVYPILGVLWEASYFPHSAGATKNSRSGLRIDIHRVSKAGLEARLISLQFSISRD